MKRILILFCLLTVIAGAVVAQEPPTDQTTWKRYTIKGEEFSVNLPTLPAMTTTRRLMKPEAREIWERRLGAYADGIVYTIYILDDGNPKKALKNAVGDVWSNSGWDRNSEQELTRDGFTGKQFVSPNANGGTVQVFATRNRYYRFQAFGAPANDPRVEQFFSSLLLGKDPEGIEVTDGQGILWKPPVEPASYSGVQNISTGKTVDRKVILIMKLEPQYTEEARMNRITGRVVLKAVFSANGSVTNIRTAEGLPFGLTEQAIDAARKIKFIPAVKEGKFVSMWMQLEYNFNLY